MRYVNPSNLPQPIFDAIAHDDHVSQGSDIGASGIPAPPRQVALLHAHKGSDAIVIDVRSRFFSLLGQAVHVILERAAKTDGVTVFAEQRAEITVDGWRVAARLDHLAYDTTRTLTDYKVTSVFAAKNWKTEPKEEWIAQVNVTHLCVVEGLGLEPFKRLQITAMLRDYSKLEALRYGHEYPEAEIVNLPVPLWPLEKTRAYVAERVHLHRAARGLLPECSPADRWAKPDVWAVKKKGGKRAVNGGLYTEQANAEAHAKTGAFEIEFRPGTTDRCRFYCDARQVCTQGQQLLAALAAAESERRDPKEE
jgi:hypothetical protein